MNPTCTGFKVQFFEFARNFFVSVIVLSLTLASDMFTVNKKPDLARGHAPTPEPSVRKDSEVYTVTHFRN